MIRDLIGNLPLTYVPVVMARYREMALLKIADTDHAFLVWNDTDKAHTSTVMQLSGQTIHFVCICSKCEFSRTGEFGEKRQAIRNACKENGIKTIYCRYPEYRGRFDSNPPTPGGPTVQWLDVHLGDVNGVGQGGWDRRLQEMLERNLNEH